MPDAFETEPNNSYLQANGPLKSEKLYHGYPDDAKDYFVIVLCSAGEIKIDLTNHTATPAQVQLFYESISNRVTYVTQPPYQITYTGAPGAYYIYIFTGGAYSTLTPYDLVTTYPQ